MFFVLSARDRLRRARHRVDAAYRLLYAAARDPARPAVWASSPWDRVPGDEGLATHTQVALPHPGELAAHAVYLQDVLGVHKFNAVYWS